MRAAWVCASLLVAGCGTRTCKSGTLLVNLTLDAESARADTLTIQVTVDGVGGNPHQVAHDPASRGGSLEVDFPQYPSGKNVSVEVRATLLGSLVGSGSNSVALQPGCGILPLTVLALGGGDLGAVDLAGADLPPGEDLAIPDLSGGDLSGADLSAADASAADASADLDASAADLSGADLSVVHDLLVAPDLFGFTGCLVAADCPSGLVCNNTVCVDDNSVVGLGSGKDGAFSGTISALTVVLSSAAGAGASSVNVNQSLGVLSGDVVMLWQSAGMPSVPSGGTSVGISGTSVGQWELMPVASATASTVTFTGTLRHSYPATVTQVIKLNQFTNVNIAAATMQAPPAFDTATQRGGIVAFLATGTVTINGTLTAQGAGFPGGVVSAHNYSGSGTNCGPKDVIDPTTGIGQGRGFGLAGNTDSVVGAAQGYGNVANGGGAGNCLVNGGGGGGNAGAGGVGGKGLIAPFAGSGGAFVDYGRVSATHHLVMGGGGGAGNQTAGHATGGGAGGGVIWFRAFGLAGNGVINADGASGVNGSDDGQGGGGAGGTIYIRIASTVSSFCGSGIISARGGAGIAAPSSGVGAGGGGGGGRLFLQVASTCVLGSNISVTGGGSGTGGIMPGAPGAISSQEPRLPGAYCSSVASVPTCSAGATPFCDLTINSCVACRDDGDCAGQTCVNHVCTP